MKASSFVQYEPTSVEQAVLMLSDVSDQDGRILAGGQTLIPAMALRLARPAYLVDINRIEEIRRLAAVGDVLSIGAGVRHCAFHARVVEAPVGELLSTVVKHIAHLPIRNRGTFCGSLANADPASEWCLVTATLGGRLSLHSVRGERVVDAADYFIGFMTTALEPDEMLAGVSLPLLDAGTRFGFEEFSRRAGDFAQAMALVVFDLDDGRIGRPRVGVGGVEGLARRIDAAEAVLDGERAEPEVFARAARAAAEAVDPADDSPIEQAYRRSLVETVVRRALEKAVTSNSGVVTGGV